MKQLTLAVVMCLSLAACGATISTPTVEAPDSSVISTSGGGGGEQLNAIRKQANLPAVRRNAALDVAAKAHADDMASRNFFSHTGSNGSSPGQRATAAGYRWCTVAENINRGYPSGPAAIEAWRKSPGHYRNMVNGKVSDYGLANTGEYWVMVLAAKNC